MSDDPRVEQLLDALLDSQATPEQVCASCPELLPVIRHRWRLMRQVRADLEVFFPPVDEPTRQPAQEMALPQIPGYEVEAVLGHGGMGVVFQARHLGLDRLVALKMLLAGAYAGPGEKDRFQREAQAVAALRHPNVVQIHDIGEVDGGPWFTMELVEGGSLAEKLGDRPQPAHQAAQLVATLAGAVQAAHACGIIHRDLKPGNVLLTADGTPKIGDFGLARRLGEGPVLTQTGAAVGTPSYMAPEQARGRRDAVGPAADIYALGVILYELLTGRPPFHAETAVVTLHQVLVEEPLPPSRLNPRVPRDLETICLKCLEKEPGKRYPTAADLAADLERFSRHEAILARPAGRLERCVRWARRRPAAAGLLAAVVLLLAAGGVGAWSLYQQRSAAQARQTRTDQEVRGVVERARGPLEEGWQAADLARLTEARAEGTRAVDIARSGGASPTVQAEAEAFQEDAAGRLDRARKTRALLDAVLDVSAPQETRGYARDAAGRVLAQPSVDEQYAAAFRRWGLDVDRTPEDEAAERLREEPDAVVQELIGGLDAWMVERRLRRRPETEWRRLVRVAERLDPSERHRRLRAWLAGGWSPRVEAMAGLVGPGSPWPALWELARGNAWRQLLEVRKDIDPRKEPVLTVVLLAQACAAVGDVAGAEEVLRQAATARPDQVVLLVALGKLLERHRLEEAIGYYRAARGQHRSLGIGLNNALVRAGRATQGEEVLRQLALQQPDNPAIHFYLGVNLSGQRKHAQAEAAYAKAIDLEPDFAKAYSNLGSALNEQRKHRQAEGASLEAIALEPHLAAPHINLGTALYGQRKPAAAEAAYREAIALQPDHAKAYSNLGSVLNDQRKHREAEAACLEAIALEPDFAEAHTNLGNALYGQGKLAAAEAAYRQAIALQPDLAEAHYNLGNALRRQGRHGEAEAAYRQAIALQPDYAKAHTNLANALNGQGKPAEAVAAYRQAIALQPDLADAHYNLGIALSALRKYGEAEAAYRKAIDLQPDDAQAHYHLGKALFAQGKPGEAAAAYRKAIALQPGFAEAYYDLGITSREQARFHEAAAALKKASDLLPRGTRGHELAQQLQQQCQRFVILDARLPAILKGAEKPANATEQIEYALLCVLKKLHATAARLYAGAFAMEPQLAEDPRTRYRYAAACSAALAGCGRGADAAEWGDAERARWRAQARQWLRADLNAWARKLESGRAVERSQVQRMLAWWWEDPDLAGLRDPEALEELPSAERQECRTLWSDLDALLERARPSR
jgi:serine/threonine-protein kinase